MRGFFDFRCPKCEEKVSFPKRLMGTVQECPRCFQDMVVPERPQEAARELRVDIRTKRLVFRRLNDKDRNDLVEIMSDGESLRYLNWQTLDGEDVEEWLVRDASVRLMELGTYVYFGIEAPAISKLVALVSFIYQDEEFKEAGFNVVVNRTLRCHGYGTETVRGVLAFAFDEVNLHRVSVGCHNQNTAGLKMLDQAGMRREGEFIENTKIRGEWVNTVFYAMLRREWHQNSATNQLK